MAATERRDHLQFSVSDRFLCHHPGTFCHQTAPDSRNAGTFSWFNSAHALFSCPGMVYIEALVHSRGRSAGKVACTERGWVTFKRKLPGVSHLGKGDPPWSTLIEWPRKRNPWPNHFH